MRDMVDNLIEVNKINNFSCIQHNWYLYKRILRCNAT
jgi:putative component of membrane protein insertase Oxa1/YidC/SpoIIIJ protein YidD